MADVTTTQDALGRQTIVTLHDDRGEPYGFVSNGVDIRGKSIYGEIISIPFTPDKTAQPKARPALKRGQILVSAHVSFRVGALNYVLADLQILGFIGSTGTVIASAQLGGACSAVRIPFGDIDTFDRISINARMLVNGVPSSVTTDILDATVIAVVDMWS